MSQVQRFRDLVAQIREDYSVYQDWTKPGFRATMLHRIAVWRLGLPAVFRLPLWWMYLTCYRWMRNHYGIDLPYTVELGRRVVIPNQGNVVFHPYSKVGDDCVIRQNVTLGAGRGGDRYQEAPILENGVEIGVGAVLVGRVRIGAGSRIGPNVVVMRNIPPNVMVMPGAPRTIPLPNFGPRAPEQPQAPENESEKGSLTA